MKKQQAKKKANKSKIDFNKLWTNIKKYLCNNYKKLIIIGLVLGLLSYVFFSFRIFITYDGAKYYDYLSHFKGTSPFSEWDEVRGPVYPFILFMVTSIFGNNGFGVLFGNFLFYLGIIYFAYKSLNIIFKENDSKHTPMYLWVLFVLLFIFNPIMIGYQHTMLTEAIIPLFYMIAVYIELKLYKITFKDNKKKYIVSSIILCILSSLSYLLKQPFAPSIWISIFITAVISGIYLKSLKEFFIKTSIFIASIVFTFITLIGWNAIIHSGENAHNSASAMTSRGIISMLYNFKKEDESTYCNDKFLENHSLSYKDKMDMESLMKNDNWCKRVEVYNVYNRDLTYKSTEIKITANDDMSLTEAISLLMKLWIKYPDLAAYSYYNNYMTITDMYNVQSKYDNFTPVAGLESDVVRENSDIALVIYNTKYYNVFWDLSSDEPVNPDVFRYNVREELGHYVGKMAKNNKIAVLMTMFGTVATFLFKMLMTFSPFFMIYSFVQFIKTKKVWYFMNTLISGMALTSILFNALFAANIDRYVYPTYVLMILALIICFMDKKQPKEGKKK